MTLTRSGDEIAVWFSLEQAGGGICGPDGARLRPRYNLAPSQPVLTVVASRGGRLACWKAWGLVPPWAGVGSAASGFFNARSETAERKPAFRATWKRHRCLVVADGFYEWTPRRRGHRAFHFRPAKAPLLGLAGLHEPESGSCTVLTTRANPDLDTIHDRMPVILAPADFDTWLDPATKPEDLVVLAKPAPRGTLERRAVGRFVHDPRVDDPRCLLPASADVSDCDGDAASRQGELFASSGGSSE